MTVPSPEIRPVARIWQVLALLVAAFVIFQDVERLAFYLNHRAGQGVYLNLARDQCGSDRWCRVTEAPAGWASETGLHVGDQVRLDRRMDASRMLLAGERIGMTVRTGTVERHVSYIVPQIGWTAGDAATARASEPFFAVCIFMALTGAFVILRSRGRPAPLFLGVAFACASLQGEYPRLWQSTPVLYPVFLTLLTAIDASVPPLFLAFARAFRRETTGGDGPVIKGLFRLVSAISILLVADRLVDQLAAPLGWQNVVSWIGYGCLWGAALLTVIVLAMGWRETSPAGRGRYQFIMVAVILTMTPLVFALIVDATGKDWRISNPLVVAMLVCQIGGAFLFPYAVLRHRVLDVGFAVNRTLIYGVLSFLILLVFGLAEWGVEKVLPRTFFEGHSELIKMLVEAGIALTIFLVFHRVRDLIEHLVEEVFFHKWRSNEERLNRFIVQAAHILKPEALKAASVAEFIRFCGGAQVALYRAERGTLVRDAGDLPGLDATLDGDLEPLVAMRAEGKPLFAEDAAALHAALVLPMVQRNDLTGFFAIGVKPSGDGYRPDERAALAEAAQKIGFDLHALRIEKAEAEAAARTAENAILRAEIGTLKEVIVASATA